MCLLSKNLLYNKRYLLYKFKFVWFYFIDFQLIIKIDQFFPYFQLVQ